jgi:hypothetical protein
MTRQDFEQPYLVATGEMLFIVKHLSHLEIVYLRWHTKIKILALGKVEEVRSGSRRDIIVSCLFK